MKKPPRDYSIEQISEGNMVPTETETRQDQGSGVVRYQGDTVVQVELHVTILVVLTLL